jgi:phage-related minor tail protein|nr:MAG TPA: minor tail protein [Caudoviricetes sp.]
MAYAGVKITANSSDYQAQMKSAANAMKVLSAEYTSAAAQAKAYGKETDGLKVKAESLTQKITVQSKIVQMNGEQQERLTKKLSEQKDEQEKLKAKIDDARAAYEKSEKETGKNSEQTKALAKELDDLEQQYKLNETAIGRTETALANQTVKTEKSKASLTDMKRELKEVNEELKNHKLNKFADACNSAGEKVEGFGKKMSVVSAGIAGIGAASIESFTELDEGYDTIVTKTGATDDALEGLTQSADNLFGSMPEDMATVGEAIGEVNTRFHSTGEELENTSKQFVQFASINDTNVTQSVDQVDKIMKAWNIDASQTGNLLGLLTAKAQETGINVDTLEGYVLDNNAAFKEMGLSLPQAINLMAQFDANGVDSTQALAGLKKSLQNATAEGKSMDVALKETIDKIKNAKSETKAMQIATELFGKKGAAEMTKAIRENRVDLTDLSSSMKEYGSTVEDTYNGTLDPIDNSKIAMNNAKLALSTLATTAQTSAAPMIEDLTGKIQDLTKWFTSLSPAQQETLIKVGLVTAAVGPLAVGFGKVAKGVSSTVKFGQKFVSGAAGIIAKITAKTAATAAGTAADTAGTAATAAHTAATTAATATTGGMTAAQTALNLAMSLCPIVLIVGLIAGLIAAGVALYKNWDKISSGAKKLWGNAKETFSNLRKSAKENFDKVAESAKQGFRNAGNEIKNSKVGKAAQDIFKKVSSTVSSNMKEAVGYARKNLGDIKDAYKEHGGGITGIVAASMTAVKKKYQLGYDVINKLTGGKLDTMVQKTREGFKKAVSSIAEKISDAKANATKFATGVMDSIKSIPGEAKDIGKNLVTGLWNGISNMSKWVTSKIKGFGDGILSDLKSFFGIHSPSKVMEEQIGKNLALGVAQGITKNQKNAKKSASEMGELIVKAATTKLKTYQTYHKMSIKQETEYWNTIRKECKKGTAARTEADKKYLADKKSLNSQMLKAQKEYAKQEKEINKNLKAQIKSLNDEYKNAVKERKNSILSSFSLFESYNAGESVSKSDLLVGMQTQVEALDEWTRQIATLKSRIGGTALFSAVQDMGVDALQQVKAMNSMSDEELQRYRKMYNQRQSTAKNEATTELTSKKESTDSQIQKATESAQKKIETAQKSYAKTLKSLGIDTKTTSKLIAQTEKPLVKSFKNIGTQATKSMKSAVSTTKKGVESLKKATTFNWSLPKLKLPHLSVSAGKSPYGIDGKGSLPKFSAEYYKNGAVMTKPTVFGLHKDRFMIGGEAGDEAILPLRAFYQNLNAMLDNKIAAVQNLQPVYVTNYTYLDGDEIASRTVTKVDRSMVKNKKKRR